MLDLLFVYVVCTCSRVCGRCGRCAHSSAHCRWKRIDGIFIVSFVWRSLCMSFGARWDIWRLLVVEHNALMFCVLALIWAPRRRIHFSLFLLHFYAFFASSFSFWCLLKCAVHTGSHAFAADTQAYTGATSQQPATCPTSDEVMRNLHSLHSFIIANPRSIHSSLL